MQQNVNRPCFRYVPEGKGGTFTVDKGIDDPLKRVSHLGTFGCHTCVGVWIPIDENRCFLAHISFAFINANGQLSWEVWVDNEANTIKTLVKSMLREEQMKSNWGRISQENRDRIVLVCPKTSETPTKAQGAGKAREVRYIGYYAVEAIREWFGVSDAGLAHPVAGGFVAKQPDGLTVLLSAVAVEGIESDLTQPQAWERKEETGSHVSEWKVVIPR